MPIRASRWRSETASRSATGPLSIRLLVGDGSLVGMGAILLNRARIGRDLLVGANALYYRGQAQFEDGMMILGQPARAMRALTEEQKAGLKLSAAVYVANFKRFATGLVEKP